MSLTVSVECTAVLAESGKALLCVVEDEEVWVPKSQIDDDSEVYQKGHSGTLIVSDWFANKQGWL